MKSTTNILLVTLSVLVMACGGQQKNENETSDESASTEAEAAAETAAEVDAVSIWDKVSVRETAAKDGKWVTSISLGETLKYLGEEQTDSEDKKYFRVRLNDGKEGWARHEFVVPEAKPGVFVNETDIYTRPDLLTKSDRKFSKMDIVAVKNAQGDWVEVEGKRTGGKWIDKGWIKSSNVSFLSEDIAMAKFAKPILDLTDAGEKKSQLEELLNNSDLSSSAFVPDIRAAHDELLNNEGEMEEVAEEVETDTVN